MKHTSALFGPFAYTEEQVITFPEGLLGYEEFTRFVLKGNQKTEPILWLLSVEEGGPDFAVVRPEEISAQYAPEKLRLKKKQLAAAGVQSAEDLRVYAVVTIPEDVRHMTMNMRAPILIGAKTKTGCQIAEPGLSGMPVRRRIYRDITGQAPDSRGTLLVHRRLNESIQIGKDITVEVVQFADGGVRLAVMAPKDVTVSRGAASVGPAEENQVAATDVHPGALERAIAASRMEKKSMSGNVIPLPAREVKRNKRETGSSRSGVAEMAQ